MPKVLPVGQAEQALEHLTAATMMCRDALMPETRPQTAGVRQDLINSGSGVAQYRATFPLRYAGASLIPLPRALRRQQSVEVTGLAGSLLPILR